jgi:hypothetical protein
LRIQEELAFDDRLLPSHGSSLYQQAMIDSCRPGLISVSAHPETLRSGDVAIMIDDKGAKSAMNASILLFFKTIGEL